MNALSRCRWTGGSKTFTYDDAGRRKTMAITGQSTVNYSWDYESRITSITKTGATTNSFEYNGLDTRTKKIDSIGTTTYRRDGAYVTDPVLADSIAGGATTKYTPGVSERRGSTSRWLHSGIKNADARTTSTVGTSPEASRTYDAFGNIVTSSGTWQGFLGYGGQSGYQDDSDFGLKLVGHRYYDASIGRFASNDPVRSGKNSYVYCVNNPIKHSDPDGLRPIMSADISRLHKLQDAARRQGVPQKNINDMTRQIKEEIARVPHDGGPVITDMDDSPELKSLWYAIDNLGSTRWAPKGTRNFCNYFVADSLDAGGTGHPKRVGRTPGPINAASWFNCPSGWQYTNRPRPGDVTAWLDDKSETTGHCAIYAGGGVTIYAGPYDVKAQTVGYVASQDKSRYRYLRRK